MTRLPEEERLSRLAEPDRAFWEREGILLAGMDEVGRGPLAGPVVVCCAAMPQNPLIRYVNDSKKVSEPRREALYSELAETALGFSLGWVWPETIDEINILQATRQAFWEAFLDMPVTVTDVLVDAMKDLDIPARQHSLIHGDALSYSIACASILAKVTRDRYMLEQDALYPEYGFARNKGYGTSEHIMALKRFGPCPIHRRSFIGKFLT
ncbi:Ribonuclease HII [bioreactor metagenome]|uniref:Ribonuclease HII n=1 Tax=bioreactor metagenome TaxID=1076179 RepID=A0A645A6C9_9ZZZZ